MRTQAYEFHKKNGKLVDFAGFEMPLYYEGIITEHLSVRNSLGLFDVSHMGRCLVDGRDSPIFLNYLVTRDLSSLAVGQGRYSLMCNENGGIVDDIVVFRLEENQFMLVYNALNREKNIAWFTSHSNDFRVSIRDISNETIMLALQGPKSPNALQPIVDVDLSSIQYYWGKWALIDGQRVYLTRTGYTGEDGFEIILWNVTASEFEKAERFWQAILTAGQEFGIKPCGLGARDTLRLEAGLCLYSKDIDEHISPSEARLDFTVQFEKRDFIGKETLLRKSTEKIRRIRVGIRAKERRIPRCGSTVWAGEREVGYLTSGTFSPLLKSGIGMGYVSVECMQVGTEVDIKTERSNFRAVVSDMPFYDQTKYGRNRLST
jgi:aminomethyltransferase